MSEHTAGAGVGTAGGTDHAKPTSSELLVVTGMSGAGRSTAANALEDLGWYVVDNLPPQMLHTLADLVARTPQALPKLAVVIDVRGNGGGNGAVIVDVRETEDRFEVTLDLPGMDPEAVGVTFEDGRKGRMSARLKIHDLPTTGVAGGLEKAA